MSTEFIEINGEMIEVESTPPMGDLNDRESTLPEWLWEWINHRGKEWKNYNGNRITLDMDADGWDKYLTTFFPRTYTESLIRFKDFFENNIEMFNDQEHLKVLDFGCGCGGEILGLIESLSRYRPDIKTVEIHGVEGNRYALSLFHELIEEANKYYDIKIVDKGIICKVINNKEDIAELDTAFEADFDLAITFKAINEFVQRGIFTGCNKKENNPYFLIGDLLVSKLRSKGYLFMGEIASGHKINGRALPQFFSEYMYQAVGQIKNIIFVSDSFKEPHKFDTYEIEKSFKKTGIPDYFDETSLMDEVYEDDKNKLSWCLRQKE